MADFYLHAKKVSNIFQLLGSLENDMSRSFAWGLAQCPHLLREFVRSTTGVDTEPAQTSIRLQVAKRSAGITDVEIECPGTVRMIVEAKSGIALPTQRQLLTYANRIKAGAKGARCLVALTDCPLDYVRVHFNTKKLNGVPVVHVSWAEVVEMALRSRSRSRLKEKYLIDELVSYLRGIINMQEIESNWVFVVALNDQKPQGWGVSWIEVVTKKKRYFHPVGNNWPSAPPNYIAFRYGGQLQSIHHIDGHVVVTDMHQAIREIPKGAIKNAHFVYRLGPAFKPSHKVPSKIARAGRRWCMLDTLFTSESIAEASKVSNQRKTKAQIG